VKITINSAYSFVLGRSFRPTRHLHSLGAPPDWLDTTETTLWIVHGNFILMMVGIDVIVKVKIAAVMA
jgi:hypothetical protein